MKILKLALLPFPLFLSYLLFGGIYFGHQDWMLSYTLCAAFLFSYLATRKETNKKTKLLKLFLVFAPMCLLDLAMLFMEGVVQELVISYTITIPIFSFLGYWYGLKEHVLTPIVSVLSAFIVGLFVFSNYLTFSDNIDSRKELPLPEMSFYNEKLEEVLLNKNKITVLEFWYSGCGYCFEKMPELEKQYLEFKNNPNVEIYSVGAPLKSESIQELDSIMSSLDYKFPKLYVKSTKEVELKLKQNAYPFLLIIKNDIIRYLGGFNTDDEIKFYRLEDEVERLL
jgi:thiol-disulfide isomerase/thioredoxin